MENKRLNEAIIFATERHSEQVRKGSELPYILHPLEVLQILYSMRAETDIMIAGILHDTVEDTDTTLDEIRQRFGDRVAELVSSNSEDKSKSWYERKKHTIEFLEKADKSVKMMILADKLSNLRSIALDYKNIGDELWRRFNAPKEKQAWYYSGIQDSLYDMQFCPECADAYWEFVGLFKDVFVSYYISEGSETLYQICVGAGTFCLSKGDPRWLKTAQCHGNIREIPRKEAELLEDIWNKPFWNCHEQDMQTGTYCVFDTPTRWINLKITGDSIVLECEDFGPGCEIISGRDGYEFSYTLKGDDAHRFLVQFRIAHGIEAPLEDLLKKEFGCDNGTVLFEQFCKKHKLDYQFFSY